MELKWLEDIIVLLEEKSFSKAAERRNVTQPAFSRRIKSVENWLDCHIVDRSTQPVTILDSAWTLEPEIRALARRMYELKGRFRTADQHLMRLDIASQHTLAVSVFPNLIDVMSKTDKSLSYRLRAADKDDCITMCLRGDASFLLSYETSSRRTELPEALFCKMPWGKDTLAPMVGGGLASLVEENGHLPGVIPVLGYPEDSFFGGVVSKQILPKLFDQYETEWRCEAAFSSSIKELCLSGAGIAWLPVSLARRELQAGELVLLSNQFETCSLEIVLHARKQDSVALRLFQMLEGSREYTEYRV